MLHVRDPSRDYASDQTLSGLFAERKPGHMLPQKLYTGEEALEADLDAIFHRQWIAVAVEADVPEPGDVYAVDIGRSSILVLRDEDETIRAFHNVCSHRAAKLVEPGHSIVGKLVCPYHQWAYELTGELTSAPHMGRDFDRGLHHLKPVAIRSVGGILFACLCEDPPEDIEALAEVVAPRLQDYALEQARVAHETEFVEDGNWKLVIENNRECYHCEANHPELCLSFHALDFGYDIEELTPKERREAEALTALYAEQTAKWEAMGLRSSAVEVWDGVETYFRTQRLIIAGAGESQTPDARAAVAMPLGAAPAGSGDTHLWGVNSWSHIMADHAVIITIFPLSTDKTLVRTKWLVHRDAEEGVDYDLENLTTVWKQTNAQDAALVARAHAGVASTGYRPGPYSPYTEAALEQFTSWYAARMAAHGYGR